MKNKHTLPKEIVEFFSGESARSLLVEGGAGTGKTTLALQLLEELADPDKSFYLTTRVGDEALYSQFPWLKEKEMRGRIVDASKALLRVLYKKEREKKPVTEETKKIATARDFLKSIDRQKGKAAKEVDRTRLNTMLEQTELPEIEGIYDRIERILPERCMLVVDSIEGLTHKYGLNQEDFVVMLEKDLVENSNTHVVLILERLGVSHLEYIVDGVAGISKSDIDGRRVREIHLSKLRATEIRQPSYLATLRFGRFQAFEPYRPDFSSPQKWIPIPDTGDMCSTGTPDLDALLGGGFRKGSYNVIEIAENVSIEEYHAILRPILLNFLSLEKGVFAVLTGGEHAETIRNDLSRFIGTATFDRYVRIVDYFVQQAGESYIMAMGTRNKEEAVRIYKENIAMLRGPENKPIIDFNGLDTLEYLRGGDVAIRDLLGAVAKIKISKDLGIGILKPGLKLTQEILNMADTHIKIIDINKCPCVYGVKPKTPIFAIVVDEEKGTPWVKLVPVV